MCPELSYYTLMRQIDIDTKHLFRIMPLHHPPRRSYLPSRRAGRNRSPLNPAVRDEFYEGETFCSLNNFLRKTLIYQLYFNIARKN